MNHKRIFNFFGVYLCRESTSIRHCIPTYGPCVPNTQDKDIEQKRNLNTLNEYSHISEKQTAIEILRNRRVANRMIHQSCNSNKTHANVASDVTLETGGYLFKTKDARRDVDRRARAARLLHCRFDMLRKAGCKRQTADFRRLRSGWLHTRCRKGDVRVG